MTDQELMREYTQETMWVFNLTDYLDNAPEIDSMPRPQLGVIQRRVAEHRDRHAALHEQLKKRGVL